MKKLLLGLAICLIADGGAVCAEEAADTFDVFARAPAQADIVTERRANGTYVTRIPFAAVRSEWGDIRLLGASAEAAVSINLAPQANILSSRLVMRHVNGLSQSSLKPQLRMALNSHFLAQLPGVTETGAAINEVPIRTDFLQSGYNTLTLDAVQRYTLECQDPLAAELWTDIDAVRSYFEITYERARFSMSLADLDAIITPGVGGVESLGIVTADEVSADTLKWGTLAAQGVGNRLKHTLPKISHLGVSDLSDPSGGRGSRAFDAMDLIVIAAQEDLPADLRMPGQDIPPGYAYLSIRPSPFNEEHFMLVISGSTPEGVERGVAAFSTMDFPMDDAPELLLAPYDVPAAGVPAVTGPVGVDRTYRFSELGLGDTSVFGVEHKAIELEFELPADVHFEEGEEVELALDFAYGAHLEPSSVINILANGQFQRAIPMKNANGEVNPGYVMLIEATALKPGLNRLAFEVELSARQEGHCVSRSMRHLAFVLKGSSTIRLPAAERLAVLPNLALVSETGYPYSGLESRSFAIVASDSDSATLAATWLMAAKLGQLHGAVFTDADYAIGEVPKQQDALLVGATGGLSRRLPAELRLSSRSQTVAAQLVSGAVDLPQALSVRTLGQNGLIVAGETAPGTGRLLTVVTAQTPERLLVAVENLVEPAFWSQMSGGAAIWRDHPATFVTQAPADVFFAGTADATTRVRMMSGRAPWAWVLGIGVLLFAMATLLAGLARYMRSRID
ncbi:cellulose biosynthesis cyclic di-GMP-binding regulatory protein BcsB [Hyphomonas sp.]|jgi:hypothetical protein|uniref:cellulose biosynthesis cyclic di-GMP-binding regulatory protein BcsB n=1 Tax=Hyphomonas sp. TaxID=87 RepID=UPI0035285D5D